MWAILNEKVLPEELPEGFRQKLQTMGIRPVTHFFDEPFRLPAQEEARAFAYAKA